MNFYKIFYFNLYVFLFFLLFFFYHLIVARSDAIFVVNLGFDGCAVSCLAKVEMLRMYTSGRS